MSADPRTFATRGIGLIVAGVLTCASACGSPASPGVTTPSVTTGNTQASVSVTLVSGTPSGAIIEVPGGPARLMPDQLAATFSIKSSVALPGAFIDVALVDGSGHPCATTSTNRRDLPANMPVTVTADAGFDWTCSPPNSTVAMVATVVTETGAQVIRTEYGSTSFPIAYSYRLNASLTIATLDWINEEVTQTCCPSSGSPIHAYCGVSEADGAPVTVTVSVVWDNSTTHSRTTVIPAGESSRPVHSFTDFVWSRNVIGAYAFVGTRTPTFTGNVLPLGTQTCTAVNSRGETATRSIRMPIPH